MLELDGLSKRYGDVVALDGASLQAQPGRILGFLGPNGAGKTTAMRSVFGLVQLDTGSVRWGGERIRPHHRLRFGYMPEQRGLYPRMPVDEQLTFLAQLRGMERDAATSSAIGWLEDLGLGDRTSEQLSQLSHGNQQRVQLAAALVHDPELLVLDEPFSGLDPLGVETMSGVLRDRARGGATVVFSSHQLDLVEALCDDVVIIAGGRIRLAGTLDEVRDATSFRVARVRLAAGEPVTPPEGTELVDAKGGVVRLRVPVGTEARWLLDRLETQGRIERFALGPPSLSEIFRDVVGASIADLEADATDEEVAA